ncbi:Myosin-I heavy chain [Phytophthora citrophthora]|uniref:Myosin-I heavy chain n=1 Tax=Phytophthora citrophthora TaxID=4793 RepID=A0AAD9L9M9_9STRA|nr:Myosin-I heavy chain [Phytophthora citrophthora]
MWKFKFSVEVVFFHCEQPMPGSTTAPTSTSSRSFKSGRLERRRGSSAAAALQAETTRLGVPNGVLKRGFLVKKGHVMPTRKERYFVLGQHSLSYYKPTKDGDVKLKGVLKLKASDVISPLPNSDVWMRIRQSEGPARKSYKIDLKASNAQERREWIEALRKACRGESLLRQRAIQSDMRLLQVRSSRRGQNSKAMAELLSSPMSLDDANTPRVDLRASFQIFHEMLLLKNLIDTIKKTWGEPSQWSMAQYQELVQGISLALEKSGSSEFEPDSILAEAFKLRYQFEEIPENQRKLSRDDDASQTPAAGKLKQANLDSPVAAAPMSPRIRCPSFHSYYATFEELSGRVGEKVAAKNKDDGGMTPRGATLAKYAHLYLLDDIRAKQPWSLDRSDDDDLMEHGGSIDSRADLEASVVETLVNRFDSDRIYTYINHHTMVVMNPYRLLQTARFTSIYDEQVVLTYADTTNAETALAPHPFAIAKQSLIRLFFDRNRKVGNSLLSSTESNKRTVSSTGNQSLFLCGESGSGKTELAKDLLKYLVLVAQPAISRMSEGGGKVSRTSRQPKITLFTSSTKSTIQMRTEEARTIALLEAKGVDKYEIVLLDLNPERWDEMMSVSRSKRLPQVHVDGLFFGFYDKLERLEDEEQLRMYFKNPHAAKKLSTVLDSNILLEAFGHATTSMNLNSSRFGKVTTLQVSFGLHPWEFQICGCHISPFLLEKSRVTNRQVGDQGDMNFHIFYAMVAGVNALPFMNSLAVELRLDGVDCSAFTYLGCTDHKLAEFVSKEDTWKKDVERWQQVVAGLDELSLSPEQQTAIFKALSAALWLGNVEITFNAASEKLMMSSTGKFNAPQRVVELLELESVENLERMLVTKVVTLQSTGETFEVTLEKGQVSHVRDALARLLYQLVFELIVVAMNETTKLDGLSNEELSVGSDAVLPQEVPLLKIIDVFGFEDLTHNSLDQLCINYLSEKLYAREEQVVAAAYSSQTTEESTHRLQEEDKGVLFLYEHPLGLFASLDELTVLHQSENENQQQEEKRNKLFVRNIYERNPLLPVPPRVVNNGRRKSITSSLNVLPFVIPHARGNVIYDASDFVKKNSDFVYANLLSGLKASRNVHFCQMLQKSGKLDSVSRKASGTSGSKSFVGQFRSHVNALTSKDSKNMPFYFHCIRPNSKKQPSVVNRDLVEQQCRSQRLIQHVNICKNPSSEYSAIDVTIEAVLARYSSLIREPYSLSEMAGNHEKLLEWINDLTCGDAFSTSKVSISGSSMVQFKSISLVEKLELLLEDREAEAAARIQSLFRMVMWRHRYLSKKRERRGLSKELLAWYGPDKIGTVQKLLKKYNGREDELRSKLEVKKKSRSREEKSMQQLANDLLSLCLGSNGGLDANAVNDILNDDDMRGLLQSNEKIVLALRDMSLNPDILESQLADQELRGFYQKLVAFLRSKKGDVAQLGTTNPTTDGQPQGSLETRILAAASEENRALWMRVVEKEDWTSQRDALVEVGEDPEMLLFHSEDDAFVTTLERFLKALALEKQCEEEQKALAAMTDLIQPSTVDEEVVFETRSSGGANDEHAELQELLLSVQFGPSLMAAMNEDPYFVQALQNPVLMNSMQQLMVNPRDFAISAALQQPAVQEFFLKLIALSFAVEEQSGEE